MPSPRKPWTDRDRLQALSLYCRLSFGQLHRHHPDIIRLAEAMGRSPSSVAMKLANYASLDPEVQALGKRGLAGASRQDHQLWERFIEQPQAVARESEEAWRALDHDIREGAPEVDYTGEEVASVQKRRVGQSLFRKAVMMRYGVRCVMTGLRHEELLIASHIVPWQDRPASRLDPANGLCLNALHDRAFDRGLLGIDGRDRIRVSPELTRREGGGPLEAQLRDLEGAPLRVSADVFPDRDYLAHHYRELFRR